MFGSTDTPNVPKPDHSIKNVIQGKELHMKCVGYSLIYQIDTESGLSDPITTNSGEVTLKFESSATIGARCLNSDGFYSNDSIIEIEVSFASFEQVHPIVTLIGSNNNVEALITCPVIVDVKTQEPISNIPICAKGDEYPTDPILQICDEQFDVSPISDELPTIVHSICLLVGTFVDLTNTTDLFVTTTIHKLHLPTISNSPMIGGLEYMFNCIIGSPTCGISACDNPLSLYSTSYNLPIACVDDGHGISGPTDNVDLLVPSISIEEAVPTFAISGSNNNVEVIVICPVLKESEPYCRISGSNPTFDDEFDCEDGRAFTIEEEEFVIIKATCVATGVSTDWSNESLFGSMTILKLFEPTCTKDNIIGGMSIEFKCDVGSPICDSDGNHLTVNSSPCLESDIIYNSKTFKAACVNQDLIGPIFTQEFNVPIADANMVKPTITIEGSANVFKVAFECPYAELNEIKAVPYCSVSGIKPSFGDDFICEDGLTDVLKSLNSVTIVSTCVLEGFSNDWTDDSIYTTRIVSAIDSPSITLTDVVGGISVISKCSIGERALCEWLSEDIDVITTESNVCQSSYELFTSKIIVSACLHESDDLLGPSLKKYIEVPDATETDTKPQLQISVSKDDSTIVKATCPSILSEVYCSVNKYPLFDDSYKCPSGGIDATPSKYGVPKDEGGHVNVYSICVPLGMFTNFEDDDLFAETEVVDMSSPEVKGGKIKFAEHNFSFGSKGISHVSVPIERIEGSDMSVDATLVIVDNDDNIQKGIIDGPVVSTNFTLSNDGIVHWDHAEDGIQYIHLIFADGLILIDSYEISLRLKSTNNEFVPLSDSPDDVLAIIVLLPNYTPYAPSNIIMESIVINDATLGGSYVALFNGVDANADDTEFEYCMLTTSNDKFLLFSERYNDKTLKRDELFYCVDDVATAYLYSNPEKVVGAGDYTIEIQVCDWNRLCFSKTFDIEVELSKAIVPTDVAVSTCGSKVSARWSLTRSASFITEYKFLLVSKFSGEVCSKVESLISKDSKAPGLSTEFLENSCSEFEFSVIACNPSGCSVASNVVEVEISEGGCQEISITTVDGGESIYSWLEPPLLIADEKSLFLDVQLPIAPSRNETVTISCSCESAFVDIIPESVEFTQDSFLLSHGEDVTVSVLDDFDHTNGPWTYHEIICKTESKTNDGSLGLYSGGVSPVSFSIRNFNIIRPRMAQIYQQMPDSHEWVATIEENTFDLPVSGAMNITIECRDDVPGKHVFPNTEITVGGISCKILDISNDGKVIQFTTPSFKEVCGDSKDCGYQQFTILNPDFAQDGSLVQDVSCPDMCPASGKGIFYTETCVGYTTGAKCLMPELSHLCSFGAGDDCKSCPDGAFCPGGYRAWTEPGFWTEDESSGSTVRCQPPADVRCPGWNATSGETECGPGFSQTSFGCMSCANGYYENTSKLCELCPESKNSYEKYMPFVYMFLAAVLMFLLTLLTIWILVKWKGGRFGEGIKRSKDFVLFSVVLLQVFVSIGNFAQAGLPNTIANMYAVLGTLNLNSPLLSAECMSSDPFAQSVFRLSLSFVVILFVLSLGTGTSYLGAKFGKRVGIWRRWSMLWLALLYPIACSESMKMIFFTTKYGNVRLMSNPSFIYFGDEHLIAGILGWIVFLFHCVGFPMLSFIVIRRILTKQKANPKEDFEEVAKRNRHLEYFIGGTYELEFFWFRHVTFFFLFITSFCYVYFNEATLLDNLARLLVETIALIVMCVLLSTRKPYRTSKRWMMPVRIYSLLLCILAMVVNIVCFMVDISSGWTQLRDILCTALFVGSIVLFLMLIYFFCSYVSSNVIDTSLKPRKQSSTFQIDFVPGGPLFSNPLCSPKPRNNSMIDPALSNNDSSQKDLEYDFDALVFTKGKSTPKWTRNDLARRHSSLSSVLQSTASSASPLPHVKHVSMLRPRERSNTSSSSGFTIIGTLEKSNRRIAASKSENNLENDDDALNDDEITIDDDSLMSIVPVEGSKSCMVSTRKKCTNIGRSPLTRSSSRMKRHRPSVVHRRVERKRVSKKMFEVSKLERTYTPTPRFLSRKRLSESSVSSLASSDLNLSCNNISMSMSNKQIFDDKGKLKVLEVYETNTK
eukprot:TRINITY_DN68_c0_g1_i2.p1 TRINITY_DN68_c0_g1~~TRINITY_DN68_c0_g1_i2.p1  ORF type:complete len:2175 (-),score=724.99 TRINITY_DN68_c0_g1_i2:470-6772(-)